MSYFKNVCLIKSPQKVDIPYTVASSDFTEICYLAGMVKNDVDSITIPVNTSEINPFRDFERYLGTHKADIVGISTMTEAYNNALEYAKIAKKHHLYVHIREHVSIMNIKEKTQSTVTIGICTIILGRL
jgi:hypothetical protein